MRPRTCLRPSPSLTLLVMQKTRFLSRGLLLGSVFLAGATFGCTEKNPNSCWNKGSTPAERNAFCVETHKLAAGDRPLVCTDRCDDLDQVFDGVDDGCAYVDDVLAAGIKTDDWCVEGNLEDALSTDTGTGTDTDSTSGTDTDTTTTGTDTTGTDTTNTTTGTESTDTTGTSTESTSSDTSCKADADCSGNTPACKLDTGRCVACTDSTLHCTAGDANVCDTNKNECVQCLENLDCSGNAAGEVCDTTVSSCVECLASTDCAENTDGQNTCDEANQSCVACLADADCLDPASPICNTTPETGDEPVCEACSEYEGQCATGICQVWTDGAGVGECFSQELYINPGNCPQSGADGTQDKPYCTLSDAFISLKANATATMHLQGSQAHAVMSTLTLASGKKVAIVGELDGPANAVIEGGGAKADAPLFSVADGSLLILDRLEVTKAVSGIVSSGDVWLRDVRMEGAFRSSDMDPVGSALTLSGGEAWLQRTQLLKFTETGVTATGSGTKMRLESSVVAQNGTSIEATAGGIRLLSAAKAEVVFSTVASNTGSGNGIQVWCDADTIGLTVRNSIVVGSGPTSVAPGCSGAMFSFSNSAYDDPGVESSATDSFLDSQDSPTYTTWFENSGSVANYHLNATKATAIAEVAKVTATDPTTDLDNELMPAIGEMTYPGADQP